MKKYIILFSLLLSSALHGQQVISATPVPFIGQSTTVSVTFSNANVPLNQYYIAWVLPGAGPLLQQFYLPQSTCSIAIVYWPGYGGVKAVPSPDGGMLASGAAGMTGASLTSEASSPLTVSNSYCTVHSYQDGSSMAVNGDGSVTFNLRIDIASSINGIRNLFFGYGTNQQGGPNWIGPLIQGGIISTWNFGPGGTSNSLVSITSGSPGTDDYAPTRSFINTTSGARSDQSGYFVVGDSYHFSVMGQPGDSVVVTRTQNGASASTLNITLNSDGQWNYDGIVAAGEVGTWTESWVIGGYVTPLLTFRVDPTGPQAMMIGPIPGSAFPSSAPTFSWSAASIGYYSLYVGTSPGAGNLFISYPAQGTQSLSVPNLPQGTIYVRLYTYMTDGSWPYNDYIYYR